MALKTKTITQYIYPEFSVEESLAKAVIAHIEKTGISEADLAAAALAAYVGTGTPAKTTKRAGRAPKAPKLEKPEGLLKTIKNLPNAQEAAQKALQVVQEYAGDDLAEEYKAKITSRLERLAEGETLPPGVPPTFPPALEAAIKQAIAA